MSKNKNDFELWWADTFKGVNAMEVIKYREGGKFSAKQGFIAAYELRDDEITKLKKENTLLKDRLDHEVKMIDSAANDEITKLKEEIKMREITIEEFELLKELAVAYVEEHYEDDSEEISTKVDMLMELFGMYQ